MISIPREATNIVSANVALDHIWKLDENGDPASLAYAPGDPVPDEEADALVKAGAKLGPSSLEGEALDAAIAEAKAGGTVETKDKRGPKDKAKPADKDKDA